MFYVVSFITLVLLLGSAALQRVVFKADQVASAVSISPANVAIKPGSETTVQVVANFVDTAVVTAAEIGLSFDPTVAEVTSTKSGSNWRLVKEKISNGLLQWVIVPASDRSVIELAGDIVLGEVTFKGTAEGRATIGLIANQTRIVAVDSNQTPSLYNSVTSTQTAIINVNDTALSTATVAIIPDTKAPESAGDLQHFRSITEVVGSTTTQILVTTDEPAAISILFGPDPKMLLNSVAASSSQAETDLQLSSLETNGTYYYQVRADMADGESILSKVRSFHTSAKSVAALSTTDVVAFPSIAAKNSTIFVVSRDSAGAVIDNLQPSLTVDSGSATVGSLTTSGGIHRSTVTTNLASQQKVAVSVKNNNQTIGSTSLSFNPNVETATEAIEPKSDVIGLTTTTLLTLLGLAFLLIVLVSLFLRLARVR